MGYTKDKIITEISTLKLHPNDFTMYAIIKSTCMKCEIAVRTLAIYDYGIMWVRSL
jgi:hypothetical protein